MIKKLTFYVLIISLTLGCLLRCSDETPKGAGELDYSEVEQIMIEMRELLDNSEVGTEDGTYPMENITKLEDAYVQLQSGYSKALAGILILQYELDSYIVAANREIQTFKNSVNFTILPGEAGELAVYGYENNGYIDFGSHPEYSSGQNWTVELWMKYDSDFFTGIGDVVSTFKAQLDAQGWMVNFSGSNLRTTIGMGPQQGRVLEWAMPYPQTFGQWMHIAAVWDTSQSPGYLKMYLNGELFWSAINGIYDANGMLQNYSPTTGGADEHKMWAFKRPGVLTSCTSGFIKKFRRWSVAKSESDIKSLMNNDVDGTEPGLTCAWDFVKVPESNIDIPDKTGKYKATINGAHKWFKPSTE